MADHPTNGKSASNAKAVSPPAITHALKPCCGIVMPISSIDNCGEGHWSEVLSIVTSAVEDAGFEANLVSNADDVGVIQKRIVQNLYDNPIVIADVSARNANVMFELGMRLAFDKATVVIKDDKTPFSFDTAPIEHLEYPRDLRFSAIVDFKKKLADKLRATYQSSTTDPDYTAFLKHFGQFKVARLEQKEVSGSEYIFEELKEMKRMIARSGRPRWSPEQRPINAPAGHEIDICLGGVDEVDLPKIQRIIENFPAITSSRLVDVGSHFHVFGGGDFDSMLERDETESALTSRVRSFKPFRRPVIRRPTVHKSDVTSDDQEN